MSAIKHAQLIEQNGSKRGARDDFGFGIQISPNFSLEDLVSHNKFV